MISPFSSELFNSEFVFNDKRFRNKELILSILFQQRGVINHCLVFSMKDANKYLIIGFDFLNKKITSLEKNTIIRALDEMLIFTNSKYNSLNFSIPFLDDAIDHFSKINIQAEDYYVYKNLVVLGSSSRKVISCNCEMENGGKHTPVKSVLFFNVSGLLYGKAHLEVNQSNIQSIRKIRLGNGTSINYAFKNDQSYGVNVEIYEGLSLSSNVYELTMSSFAHELQHIKTGIYTSEGLNIHSHINALLRTAGFKKDQINIEGFEASFSPYLVVIPIENLIIEHGNIGMGDINFYNKDHLFSKYSSLNEFYHQESIEHFQAFGQTIVEADNIFDAYQDALKKIQSAIELILLATKNDRIFNGYNLDFEFNRWSKFNLYQNPQCSTYYYVENIIGFEKIFSDSKKNRDNISLNINPDTKEELLKLEYYEKQFQKRLLNTSPQIFNSLKWLIRSWRAENVEDKIIYTNISLEFLVDNVKTEPYLPKDVVKEFKNDLKSILNSKVIYSEDIKMKIKEKSLGALSNPPLKVKVQKLISDLEVPISEKEFNKLWVVRSYRNDLVHGRGNLNIEPENVLVANLALGELITYQLKAEESV